MELERRTTELSGSQAESVAIPVVLILLVTVIVAVYVLIWILITNSHTNDALLVLDVLQNGEREQSDKRIVTIARFTRYQFEPGGESFHGYIQHRVLEPGHDRDTGEVIVQMSKELAAFSEHERRGIMHAARQGEVSAEEMPYFHSWWRSMLFAGWIGTMVAAAWGWFALCWVYGILDGFHPWSMISWHLPVVRIAIALTLPVFLLNVLTWGLFYCVGFVAARLRVTSMSVVSVSSTSAEQQGGQYLGLSKVEVAERVSQVQAEHVTSCQAFIRLDQEVRETRLQMAAEKHARAVEAFEAAQKTLVKERVRFARIQKYREKGLAKTSSAAMKFQRLLSHPCVRAVAVDAKGVVCLYLTTIYISAGFRRYEIGDFVLVCKPLKNNVHTDGMRSTNPDAFHPHGEGGQVCFGRAGDELRLLQLQGRWYALVDRAVEMMTKSTGPIYGWKEVSHE